MSNSKDEASSGGRRGRRYKIQINRVLQTGVETNSETLSFPGGRPDITCANHFGKIQGE